VKGKDNGLEILKKYTNLTLIIMIKGLPGLKHHEIMPIYESS